MIIESLKFGKLDVDESEIFIFPEGLIGFPSMTKYVFLEDPQWHPFVYMQSLDLSSLSFVVTDARNFFENYSVALPQSEIKGLELREDESPRIMVVLTVYKDVENTTANLKGPIILNERLKCGKQLVLLNSRYSTKEKVFKAGSSGIVPGEGSSIAGPDRVNGNKVS